VHGDPPRVAAGDGSTGDGADDAADDGRVRSTHRVAEDRAGARAENRSGNRITGCGRAAEAEGHNADETACEYRAAAFRTAESL
jgi:hypothetical protein